MVSDTIYLIMDLDEIAELFVGTIAQFQNCFASNSFDTIEEHEGFMKSFAEQCRCDLYKRL